MNTDHENAAAELLLDLWAEDGPDGLAAHCCRGCASTVSSIGTASTGGGTLATGGSVATASSAGTGCS